MTVHALKSVKDNVDIEMKMIKLATNFYAKHASFSSSSKAERVGSIKLNKMLSNKLGHEYLEDVEKLDDAIHEGKSFKVPEVLMLARKME